MTTLSTPSVTSEENMINNFMKFIILWGFYWDFKGTLIQLDKQKELYKKQENEWQMVYNITNTTYCI